MGVGRLYRQSPLLTRMVLYLAVFGVAAVFFTAVLGSNSEYRYKIEHIRQYVAGLEQTQVPVLTRNLWTMNDEAVRLQLSSLLQNRDLIYLEITDASGVLFKDGERPAAGEPVISQTFHLIYETNGNKVDLGRFLVCATTKNAWRDVVEDIPLQSGLNVVIIVLICVFVFFLFYFMVSRHLQRIAMFAAELDFDNLGRELLLNRKSHSRPDELERIVTAFNEMRRRLIADRDMMASQQTRLLEGQQKYETIYNAASDAIFIHDAATGMVEEVNLSMLAMFKCSHNEALAGFPQAFTEIDGVYKPELAMRRIEAAIKEGPQRFEWHARRGTGEPFWAEVGLRYAEFGGRGHVVAVVRDIEARKQMEIALKAEQQRLLVTIQGIGDGVITTDIKGQITLINQVAQELTGWHQLEACGRSLAEVFHIVNEQTGKLCEDPVSKVLASGKIIGLANHTVLIARDGSRRVIADSGAPIRDEEGDVIGVVLVFSDVTLKARLDADLQRVKKLEAVGVLAGGIAHDFNNILAAILGNINMARLELEAGSGVDELLAEAERASLRAKGLTGQLLTFARGGEPIKDVANLDEVIRDSADFVLRGGKASCRYDFETKLWPVMIDSGQVSQVIQNMVINAQQAMPQGGEIVISCHNFSETDGDFVRLVIRDEGAGMEPSVVERIFDPYFTTRDEGNGLGLAVSHSIIHKHNGRLRVESVPGKGTSFIIDLPAVKSGSAAVNGGKIVQDTHAGTVKGGTVIILDDERPLRDLAALMLGRLGYETVKTANGREAVERYQELFKAGKAPELVIMDLTIPGGMGGQAAAAEILAIDPAARLVVASGYSNDPVMAHCREFGFRAAISKPYQLTELRTVINQAMTSGR
ncbi:ATP-binding protein [Desulfobacterota bacterium M19]